MTTKAKVRNIPIGQPIEAVEEGVEQEYTGPATRDTSPTPSLIDETNVSPEHAPPSRRQDVVTKSKSAGNSNKALVQGSWDTTSQGETRVQTAMDPCGVKSASGERGKCSDIAILQELQECELKLKKAEEEAEKHKKLLAAKQATFKKAEEEAEKYKKLLATKQSTFKKAEEEAEKYKRLLASKQSTFKKAEEEAEKYKKLLATKQGTFKRAEEDAEKYKKLLATKQDTLKKAEEEAKKYKKLLAEKQGICRCAGPNALANRNELTTRSGNTACAGKKLPSTSKNSANARHVKNENKNLAENVARVSSEERPPAQDVETLRQAARDSRTLAEQAQRETAQAKRQMEQAQHETAQAQCEATQAQQRTEQAQSETAQAQREAAKAQQQMKQARRETEQALRETEQAWRATAQAQCEATQAQQRTEQAQRETAQAQREAAKAQQQMKQAQRETEQALHETEQAWRTTAQAQREAAQARQKMEQARHETEQAQRETEQAQCETAQALRETKKAQQETAQARSETAQVQRQMEQTQTTKARHETETVEQAREETMQARREAAQATETLNNLFQMLQTQVVKRKSTGRGHFPNGDGIETIMQQNQQEADDFFRDLADLLPDKASQAHLRVLDRVLAPTSSKALSRARSFVTQKRTHLLALIGDKNETLLTQENTLVSLMWISCMQARVMEKIDQADNEPINKPQYIPDGTNAWAWEDETLYHEAMDGRTIQDFLFGLMHLQWVCEFSDPPCFLHPRVGDVVEYNPRWHNLQTLPGGRNVPVRHGATVRVLYPGLYFAPPDTLERNGKPVAPKVKALVVCFHRSHEQSHKRNGNAGGERVKAIMARLQKCYTHKPYI